MELQAYLDRIEYDGPVEPDPEVLKALHRQHLLNIPYENFDVMLGRSLDLDPARAFDKLVTRRRGGWCYEMNGVFAWALGEIGFEVMPMAGGVWRSETEFSPFGNHLVLEVDRAWLADVGFGNGLFEPVRIKEGPIVQRGFESGLYAAGREGWRFVNPQSGGTHGFEFVRRRADPALLAERCHALQQDDSVFRQNTVVQIHSTDGIDTLRGSILSTTSGSGVERRLVSGVNEYMELLVSVFGIDLPEAASLWSVVDERSRSYLRDNPGLLTA